MKIDRRFVIRVCKRLKPLFLSEALYLRVRFRLEMGYSLHLKHPKTFSEKLQWLKLYNRRPEYTTMVDKYAVKDYVAAKIGREYVIPTLGVWNSPDEITWDQLPRQFVLKTTHGGGSGGVVIVKDKDNTDKEAVSRKLSSALKQDIAYYSCEWPYRNVPRRIIAEEYIEPAAGVADLPDYKWFCFDGEPRYCQVIQDRHSHETIDFFDTAWNHQDFIGLNPAASPAAQPPKRPKNLDAQIAIARKLSEGMSFSRIDLYEVNDKEYFGEITLYPASGFGVFTPDDYNVLLGQMMTLPGEKCGGGGKITLGDSEIVAETQELRDYKFFCFNGRVQFLKADIGRFTEHHANYYDRDFRLLPFGEALYMPDIQAVVSKPEGFTTMILLAEKLSFGIPFLRVDMYNVNGRILLGELTFFPASGMENYKPAEWDEKIGNMLQLPTRKHK